MASIVAPVSPRADVGERKWEVSMFWSVLDNKADK